MDAENAVTLPIVHQNEDPHESNLHALSLEKPDVTSSQTSSNTSASTKSTLATSISTLSSSSCTSQESPSYATSDKASFKAGTYTMSRPVGRSGPHTSSSARYPCLYPGCGHIAARSYDLEKHVNTHYPETLQRLDCPYAQNGFCGRMGPRGFTREDHRKEHIRKVHPRASSRTKE